MQPSGLKVVALISGGKDSLFSILHCLENGHEVVALGNLHPPDSSSPNGVSIDQAGDPDELDSHFYQTVGHKVVPLYAEALGLPLYRKTIRGTNIDTAKVYHVVRSPPSAGSETADQEDEIESLVPLLERIKRAHPSVNAITTGAILSDYQRTRVESVALRLGLTPLAYLWQFPRLPPQTQTSLLDDMRAAGQDSRIIKVSSGGLGEHHLWLSVQEESTMRRLVRDFAKLGGASLETGSALGEGGEFETLCLSGPRSLWKKRIVIDDTERETVKGDAGSWTLRVKAARCEDLDQSQTQEHSVRVPDLYDSKFANIEQRLREDDTVQQKRRRIEELKSSPGSLKTLQDPTVVRDKLPTWSTIGTRSERLISNMTSDCGSKAIVTQTMDIMNRLCKLLASDDLDTSHISQTVVLLRDMADFALFNATYAKYFDKPSPPARVTVACGDRLPTGKLVMLSVWTRRTLWADREGLHVQSRSYWAPANIGPYSQAISVPLPDHERTRTVVVAGQIPLRPASMEMISQDFAEQVLLSLQHLWRVGQAIRVHWWYAGAIAFVSATSPEVAQEQAAIVGECWRLAHTSTDEDEDRDGEPDQDIADQSLYRSWANPNTSVSLKTPLWPLPCQTPVTDGSGDGFPKTPPCFTVQVETLPRGAQVEWWSQGLEFRASPRYDLDAKFLVIKKDTDLDADTKYDLEDANGPVEAFVTDAVPEVFLAHADRIHAMVIPCHGIYSTTESDIAALIRYR